MDNSSQLLLRALLPSLAALCGFGGRGAVLGELPLGRHQPVGDALPDEPAAHARQAVLAKLDKEAADALGRRIGFRARDARLEHGRGDARGGPAQRRDDFCRQRVRRRRRREGLLPDGHRRGHQRDQDDVEHATHDEVGQVELELAPEVVAALADLGDRRAPGVDRDLGADLFVG